MNGILTSIYMSVFLNINLDLKYAFNKSLAQLSLTAAMELLQKLIQLVRVKCKVGILTFREIIFSHTL